MLHSPEFIGPPLDVHAVSRLLEQHSTGSGQRLTHPQKHLTSGASTPLAFPDDQLNWSHQAHRKEKELELYKVYGTVVFRLVENLARFQLERDAFKAELRTITGKEPHVQI